MNVLFAGGGTGGHLFPALAIAEAVQQSDPNVQISFVGTSDKLEARIVPTYGFDFYPIWISGFRRTFSLDNILFPLKVLVSLVQSWKILRRVQPDVVVGTGGYVCGPVLYAATKKKIPTLMQEQNSYPGITTRLLASRVDEMHITFERSKAYLRDVKNIFLSGTPVRTSIRRIDEQHARRKFGIPPKRKTLFVFGGSQGSSAINRAIAACLPMLIDNNIHVLWQTGASEFEQMKAFAVSHFPYVSPHAFISEMHAAYSAADLVVCRSGASSLSEIMALGVASVLIPYPSAAANHQYENARSLADEDAAILLEEKELQKLPEILLSLLFDERRLRDMRSRVSRMARGEAASTIAEAITRLARKKTETH